MGSIDAAELGSEKKPNPGKATILALGKAFPQQLVMQEYLVDGYFKTTNCDDPELKQKLTRLCNVFPSHLVSFSFLISFPKLLRREVFLTVHLLLL